MNHCWRIDCKYRAQPFSENGCDYITITGHSRIKDLPPDKQDPADCPYYIKTDIIGRSPVTVSKKSGLSYALQKEKQFNWRDVNPRLALLTPAEISNIVGCSGRAAADWKRRTLKKKGKLI